VRVEKPDELALALLGDQGWVMAGLQAAYASPRTLRIELAQPVPVFLDYRTAFVDEQGRLNLRPDLYGYDRAGIIEFDGKAALPRPNLADNASLPPTVRRNPIPTPPTRPAS
jgi:murein L,D-transpeptidase YcbB/YkuD